MTSFEKYLIDRHDRATGTEYRMLIEGILERYRKEIEPKFDLLDAVKHIHAAGAFNISITQNYNVDMNIMQYEFSHQYDFGKFHHSGWLEDYEFMFELLKYLKNNFDYKPRVNQFFDNLKPQNKGERSDD